MTSVDEQFARDIFAVTGSIVVSESDLREARRAVDERVGGQRPHHRRRTAVVAVAAAAAVAAVGTTVLLTLGGDDETTQLAGPGASLPHPHLIGSPPTAQLVEGIWRLDNGGIVVKFDEDGTVLFDDRGTLFSQPSTTGSYTVVGDVITVTTTDADRAGCLGTESALRASFPEPGAMRFLRVDTTGTCSPLQTGRGALEQLLPTPGSMAELVFSGDVGWEPVTADPVLHGMWLAEGGGHVLEMDPDGAYFIADSSGEPIDSGQWARRDAGLTLTSSARSSTCGEGDRLTLGSVEWIDPGTRAFRGTLAENACGGAWTPAAWILIPNENS